LHYHSHAIIHHTSVFSIGIYPFRHLSHIRIVFPLGFFFHIKTRRRSAEIYPRSFNRRSSFVRNFQSSLGIYLYSACLIRNSLTGSLPPPISRRSNRSLCDSALSYLSTTTFLMSYLSLPHRATPSPDLCGPWLPAIRWIHQHCCYTSRTYAWSHLHHGFWRLAIVYGFHCTPIFTFYASCFLVDVFHCVSPSLHIRCECVCFARTLLLRNSDPSTTRNPFPPTT
jgi:hypothetical protein